MDAARMITAAAFCSSLDTPSVPAANDTEAAPS
jgi:hypothetical protein